MLGGGQLPGRLEGGDRTGIYNTILLNDIVKRLKIADVNMLEAITRFLMHNIGSMTAPTTIANTMKSNENRPENSGQVYS